jgi:hypothetical protein
MIHKRTLALLCAPLVACSFLAVVTATAPGAHAFCTAEDQEAGNCPPTQTTAPPATTPPVPPAALRTTYAGTIYGGSTSAQVVLTFSGSPGAVGATVSIADGLHVDCHGDQTVGMIDFSVSGYRTAANANGTSTYYLHREADTTLGGVDVSLSLSTYASLSADGRVLGGPVSLHAGLPWYLSDCDANWSFWTRAL